MKEMIESRELLAQYAETRAEDAFRELVGRYINLVYSTALRVVGGDRPLAEDVTQTVFVHLCRNAGELSRDVMLGGWLHRDTCYAASKALRGERRRQAREQQVALMESLPDHTQANLATVAPILDEAINLLGEEDRAAILLRFFEQRDFRSVGVALGSNEDAARMRVSRALEKLHALLSKRGVALSTAALAAGLAGEAVTAAPAALASTVAGAALAGSAAAGGTTIIKLITMTKIKAGIIGAVVLSGVAVPVWLQHQAQLAVREENRALHQQVDQFGAENERLSNQVMRASSAPTADGEQERELLRLRGEVGNLRRQVAEAAKVQAATRKAPPPAEIANTAEDEVKVAGIAKMNYTRNWVIAFLLYAQKNQDQLPASFEQAAPFLPEQAVAEASQPSAVKYGLTPDQLEIAYQGSLSSLANPQTVILLREKQPWQNANGGWAKGYAFADGHSEIHSAMDGNFATWEAQHMVPPPAAQPGQ